MLAKLLTFSIDVAYDYPVGALGPKLDERQVNKVFLGSAECPVAFPVGGILGRVEGTREISFGAEKSDVVVLFGALG